MTNLIIDPEFKALIPPLSSDEYNGLEKLIVADGCRDPIVVWNNTLIDGHNRYEICTKHNLPFKIQEMSFTSRDDVIDWMYSTQLSRRNLTDESRTYLIGQQYIARKKRDGASLGNKNALKQLPQNEGIVLLPQNEGVKTETAEKMSEELKVSRATVERAAEYARAVNTVSSNVGMETLKAKILQGEVKAAKKDIVELSKLKTEDQIKVVAKIEADPKRELKVILRENVIENRNNSLVTRVVPEGKYDVILADPPWEYSNSGFAMSAANQYPTMSVDQMIAEIPVKTLANDNAIIFMWATNPLLPDALRLMNAWGFEYKTNMCWVKERHTAGFYVFGQHELLLIGVKGAMLPNGDKQKSVINGSNDIHSKKPEVVYSIIEQMYPHMQYIELFARNTHYGWSVWGNEV